MQIKCHKCGQAFSTVTSLSKHRRFCDSTPAPTAAPYGLVNTSPIKSPPPLSTPSKTLDPKSPSNLINRPSAHVAPAVAPPPPPPPPPLYPGMLQPYLLQQAMASGSPLAAGAAALPFYPNFLQQLARFQNQAQLSSLLQSNKRATPPMPTMTATDTLENDTKTSPTKEEAEKSFDVNRNKSNASPELNHNEKEVKTPLDLSLTKAEEDEIVER